MKRKQSSRNHKRNNQIFHPQKTTICQFLKNTHPAPDEFPQRGYVIPSSRENQLVALLLKYSQFSCVKFPQDPSSGNFLTHFCVSTPMQICNPMSANTDNENIVNMITSRRFFTDSMTAPTIVFKPGKIVSNCHLLMSKNQVTFVQLVSFIFSLYFKTRTNYNYLEKQC